MTIDLDTLVAVIIGSLSVGILLGAGAGVAMTEHKNDKGSK